MWAPPALARQETAPYQRLQGSALTPRKDCDKHGLACNSTQPAVSTLLFSRMQHLMFCQEAVELHIEVASVSSHSKMEISLSLF